MIERQNGIFPIFTKRIGDDRNTRIPNDSRQISETLTGRTITDVFNATHPHKFTWFSGDPLVYPELLRGRKICSSAGYGAFVDMDLEDDTHLLLSDGGVLRLCDADAVVPSKYQLLLTPTTTAFWL